MTPDEARQRLQEIQEIADRGDDEMAHAGEDQLYIDVLRAIVQDKAHAQELAKVALEAKEIEFFRWHA
jgi:hypothetical protein